MPLLYRSLRTLLSLAVDLYFVDVQATGRAHVPADGPVIFAANHPNSIMDTVILGTQVRRQIHYMARSGLFDNPVVAAIFDRCGVIPIHKQPADDTSNVEAFEHAYHVLEQGLALGIFPEGQNSLEREVLRIKTGTARIALAAEARNDYALGVQIVPVGLNFENRDQFLSKVLIRFGEPIAAADYAARHRAEPREAVRELTAAIAERIRVAATHIEGQKVRHLVEYVDQIYGRRLLDNMVAWREKQSAGYSFEDLRSGKVDDALLVDALVDDDDEPGLTKRLFDLVRIGGRHGDAEDLEQRLWVQRRIAEALTYYERTEPELVERVQMRVWRYADHVRQVRLRMDFHERPPQTLSIRKEALKFTAYAVLLAVPAVWGLINNFVPYNLTRFATLAAPDEAIRAITALVAGTVFFGLFHLGQTAALWWLTGGDWLVALAYLLTLPVSGFLFLRYRRQLSRYRSRILTRTLFRTERHLIENLDRERAELVAIFDDLRDRFREAEEAGRVQAALDADTAELEALRVTAGST